MRQPEIQRPDPARSNARTVAAAVLTQVLGQGRSLTECLAPTVGKLSDRRDRALARELCFGVMRWLLRLDAVLSQSLRKPLRQKDADLRALLLLGIYQLVYTRVPPHAAVGETVAAAGMLGKVWAKDLVNAVLRNVQRHREALLAVADQEEHARHAHPGWLVDLIRDAWPTDWTRIVEANNQHPPLAVRINARKTDRSRYLELLQERGLAAKSIPHVRQGLVLTKPVDVEKLPGFEKGLVSVQDGAAQLAADLLDVAPGQRVLDACAAPGGKTAHILEQESGLGHLVAVEKDAERLKRLSETLERLGLEAEIVCGDAADTNAWWDRHPFQRILLDAPCSATGIIRRHPDIKFHRRPDDLPKLIKEQDRLLEALWPMLVPGGMLLYATCSILPQENMQRVHAFLARHRDARPSHLSVDWGRPVVVGRQILPGEHGMDGFYYARLEKRL